ncbi:efflux RND transporter periplasmic adaptor subunit [Ampullimonas aquatilis]|uniref:efflux RND transporter periplasmic adaptor subunit n=1 Tax=Ampullimonas aquatilis TaxID=1341549 RepID=UPI003C72EA84
MKFSHTPTLQIVTKLLTSMLLVSLIGCSHKAAEEKTDGDPVVTGETIRFPVVEGGQTNLPVEQPAEDSARSLSIPGRLVWNEDHTVRVLTPFNGRVIQVLVNQGDTVKAGQPLAILSSADFGQAQADARKAEADARLAQQTLQRQKELFDAGIIAKKDLQQAQNDLADAQTEFERTSVRLKQLGADASSVNERFALKAPIGGVLVERHINTGQELRTDQSDTPQFVISDPGSLWAQLDATEADLGRFHPGTSLKLRMVAYPNEIFRATVELASDYIDPVARTIKIRAVVPNPDHKLKAEMFTNAEMILPAIAGLSIPPKAVFLKGDQNYVFIQTGKGEYTRKAVKIGQESSGMVPILAGLDTHDLVVIDGCLYLEQLVETAQYAPVIDTKKGGTTATTPAK